MYPLRRDIARSFSRSAQTYDAGGDFHRMVARKVVDEVLATGASTNRVLEIGVHTGVQTELLLASIPQPELLVLMDIQRGGLNTLSTKGLEGQKVCADGEYLPFASQSFDLIVSGSTFQWYSDWKNSVEKTLSLLKPGASLVFSQFIEPSLEPLKSVFSSLGRPASFLPLLNEDTLYGEAESFGLCSWQKVEQTWYFSSMNSLVAFLRSMGIHASSNRSQPLRRSELVQLHDLIEGYREEQGIPLKLCAGIVTVKV